MPGDWLANGGSYGTEQEVVFNRSAVACVERRRSCKGLWAPDNYLETCLRDRHRADRSDARCPLASFQRRWTGAWNCDGTGHRCVVPHTALAAAYDLASPAQLASS